MKIKGIAAVFVCAILLFYALGAAGVIRMADTKAKADSAADRLIGVFVTYEHLDLFDFEGYMRDNVDTIFAGGEISESKRDAYQGRLYAALIDKTYTNPETGETTTYPEYVFEGVEGICFFSALYKDDMGDHYSTGSDDAVSDIRASYSSTDDGGSVSLEGTIYISTTGGPDVLYFNPVYQTETGDVYALTGQGLSYGGYKNAGVSGSHSIKEETTSALGGDKQTHGSQTKVTVCYVNAPISVALIQLGDQSEVLSRAEYAPGALPDALKAEPGAEYIIVETRAKDAGGEASVARELFQPGDESLYALYSRDDGICAKRYSSIQWGS